MVPELRPISNLVQMMRLVDPPHLNVTIQDIDLVDAARMLRNTPIGRQRLIEQLKEQGPVYAVMTDEDDGVVGVIRENEPQRVGGSSDQILERIAAGESHEMRGCKPGGEQPGILGANFVVTSKLPRPIVDIPEIIEYAVLELADLRDRVTGCYASDKRARVNPGWLPSGRNAPGDAIRLGTAACGQRNVGESAKSLRFDAFDVSVADQENFGHDAIPPLDAIIILTPRAVIKVRADASSTCFAISAPCFPLSTQVID